MAAAEYNFPTHIRGDAFKARVIKLWTDTLNTVKLDCTGAKVLIQVRKNRKSPVIIQWSTEDSTITITNENEWNLAKKTGAQMDFEEFDYIYDAQMELAGETGDPLTYFKGIFPIVNDVTFE